MSSNPFDMKTLYQAGYSSVYDPTKDRSDQNNAINTILGFALEQTGQWAVSRYRQNYAELKELKAMGRVSKSAVQMEMNKVGGILSPQMQQALTQFKQEYDKGARMSVRGLTRKRKEKGQEMMDMAYMKMTTLSSQLKTVNEEMQRQMDNGLHELGEKAEGSERNGWSNGSTVAQLENSIQLATGKMLTNLEVDLNTGEINYLTQEDADVSEESYNEYVKDVGGPGEGVLSQEEWALTQQANMPINKKAFNKLDWAQEDDQTIGDQMAELYNSAQQDGLKGGIINEFDMQKLKTKLNKVFRDGSDNAIRSFMFGSEVSVMVDGKLQMVTPAMKLLIDKGYEPGDANAEEGSEEKRKYDEFQGALTDLREQDFSKGSKYREDLLNITTDSIMAYQQDGLNEYNLKQETKQNNQQLNNPTKEKQLYDVDSRGGYISRQDGKRKAEQMVESNSITFGGQYKYVNNGDGTISVYFADRAKDSGNIVYYLRETMTINQALNFRNLDGLGYEVEEAEPKKTEEEQEETVYSPKEGVNTEQDENERQDLITQLRGAYPDGPPGAYGPFGGLSLKTLRKIMKNYKDQIAQDIKPTPF